MRIMKLNWSWLTFLVIFIISKKLLAIHMKKLCFKEKTQQKKSAIIPKSIFKKKRRRYNSTQRKNYKLTLSSIFNMDSNWLLISSKLESSSVIVTKSVVLVIELADVDVTLLEPSWLSCVWNFFGWGLL